MWGADKTNLLGQLRTVVLKRGAKEPRNAQNCRSLMFSYDTMGPGSVPGWILVGFIYSLQWVYKDSNDIKVPWCGL